MSSFVITSVVTIVMLISMYLLIYLKDTFFSTRLSDRDHIWQAYEDRDETGSHLKQN